MKTTQTQKAMRGRSRLKNSQSRLNNGRSRLKKQKIKKTETKRSTLDLLLALFFLFLLVLLMFYSSPADVANIIFPNFYLPFLVLVFFATFSLFKFVFINQRLAFCLIFNLLILIFFRLQGLDFNYYLIIVLSLAPLIWLIVHQIEKRLL